MKNRNDNLKRVIVDFKKLTPEILGLLVEKHPDGYDEDHIIKFRNAKNELIEAVQVDTEDTKYLIKVSTKLMNDYDDFEEDDPDAVQDPEVDSDVEPSEDPADLD